VPEVAGDAAILIDGTNVKELAEALESVLTKENLRESLVQKGFNRVKQFSWQKTAEQTLRVYDELYEETKQDKAREDSDTDWHEWAQLQFQDMRHLEKQIAELNKALRIREKNLETILGSRTLNLLRKIRKAVGAIQR
jgi:hypothetical protein